MSRYTVFTSGVGLFSVNYSSAVCISIVRNSTLAAEHKEELPVAKQYGNRLVSLINARTRATARPEWH